ncbi:hypothetical protein FOL47_000807, partial [Perkinsus chesapeaki]
TANVSIEEVRREQRSEATKSSRLGETTFQRVIYHSSCMPQGRDSSASASLRNAALVPQETSTSKSINTVCGVVVFPHVENKGTSVELSSLTRARKIGRGPLLDYLVAQLNIAGSGDCPRKPLPLPAMTARLLWQSRLEDELYIKKRSKQAVDESFMNHDESERFMAMYDNHSRMFFSMANPKRQWVRRKAT